MTSYRSNRGYHLQRGKERSEQKTKDTWISYINIWSCLQEWTPPPPKKNVDPSSTLDCANLEFHNVVALHLGAYANN